jgi:hypothetical protein
MAMLVITRGYIIARLWSAGLDDLGTPWGSLMQRLKCCAPVFQLSLAVPSEGPWLSGSWLHRNQWSGASVNRALPLPPAEYFIWSFPIMESTHNQISPNYLYDYPKSSRLTTRSLKPMAMTYHFRTPPWLATYYAIFHPGFVSKLWPFLEQEQNLCAPFESPC